MSNTVLATHTLSKPAGSVWTPLFDFISLLKPRVMSLVVFTGFVGLYLAPGDGNPILQTIAILCIAFGAGASGAINMWYDRDIDAIMSRTKARAIPSGKVTAEAALTFGVLLAGGSVMVMGLAINWVAATLLMVEKIEHIVARQTEAIANLKIDKITVWDSGNGNGGEGGSTANFVSSLIKSLPPVHDVAKMAGVDLPDYLGSMKEE